MNRKSTLKTTASLTALVAAGVAGFGSTAVSAQDSDAEFTLEEIMVTATRRGDTDLQSTPVAVTAMNTATIEKYSPRDLNDMAVMVPSLSAGQASGFRNAAFAMRGVSEDSTIIYKESPVGVTIDDFVVPSLQTSNLEMFDIEQVEVLRGPQGTLFGKNTTGGVINVRTKAPELDMTEVDLRVEFGSFETRKFTAAVNVPLGEKVAFRFAGLYMKSDGYVRNGYSYGPLFDGLGPGVGGTSASGDNRRLGGDDVFSGRAKLLWQPNDGAKVLFQYERIRDNGETPPIINESTPEYVFNFWGFGEGSQDDPLDRGGVTERTGLLFDLDDGHQVDVDGYYMNTEFDLSDTMTFFSNTGYRKQKSRLPSSYTGTVGPISLFDASRDDDRDTFQHEMRIATDSDDPLNWVAGVFYQKNDANFCVTQYVGFLDFFGLPGDFNNNALVLCNAQDAKAYAAFADGTYDVNDRLHISAGIRYTNEKKSWAGRPRVPFSLLDGSPDPTTFDELLDASDFDRFPTGVVRDSESWNVFTYRANVAYDISDDTMVYANYSRGFKSGGYNDQLGTQLNPITPLSARPTEPEKADSFELGIKGSFMEDRATYAVTVFDVTYKDAQRSFNVSFPSGGQETLFFNAAKMKVRGVEFESSLLATPDLTFRVGGSWTPKADYVNFQADTNFDGVIDIDLSDRPMTRVPEWKIGADATYSYDMDNGSLDFNFRMSHQSESIQTYSDIGPAFDTTLNARTLFDASITYRSDDDRWFARLVGKNLTDERYRTGSLAVATLWVMSSYAPPRYLGLELGTKF